MLIPRRILSRFAVVMLGACLASAVSASEGLHRIHVGDGFPEFSLPGADGAPFVYKPGAGRVLGIIILQAGQSNIERMVADVKTLNQEIRSQKAAFDCVGVVSGPGGREFIQAHHPGSDSSVVLVADADFVFWGRLGVIASPTAVVVGSDGKIQWARAGYGYDFIAGFHAQLKKALGLLVGNDASVHVEVLENGSDHARRDRHIQMARALAKKGRIGPAIDDLQKVYDLDPNATEVALELAEMQCRAGQNEAALKIATTAKIKTDQDRARSLLIRGWAKRQMKQLDEAESLLKSALELNPRSARALYELGGIYESAGSAEKALACYRRGLEEVLEETPVVNPSQK